MSSACHQHVISMSNKHGISVSSACHQHVISMSSACHQHVISMSSARHQHVTNMSAACHQHVIIMSSSCHINMASACHQHVISMSSPCHLAAFRIQSLFFRAVTGRPFRLAFLGLTMKELACCRSQFWPVAQSLKVPPREMSTGKRSESS